MSRYDLAVLGGTVVVPDLGPVRCDVGVRGGRIAALVDDIDPASAAQVIDARGRLVLPGAVDAHFHVGIYRPMAEDAERETASALIGGVTTVLTYFRTGSHYLNRTGPYREIYPEVLRTVEGRCHTDYGFHVAIMTSEQLDEVDWLVESQGVGSFKYYMFYKGLNLAADSTQASAYTMSDCYDLGHLYRFMQRVAEASRRHGRHGRVSLSIHCEHPELIRTFIDEVKALGLPETLETYSRARPPLTERLAIAEAGLLADAAACPVNFLHLSSAEALEASIKAGRDYPALDLRLETTLHHLALTTETAGGLIGKVNPPIRGPRDVAALWEGVARGSISQVVSDHACCLAEHKQQGLWSSLPGFGGTALLYPVLLSEGARKRGLPLERVAALASANPARNFGLWPRKGTIAVGADADLAVVDPNREVTVTPDLLLSAQDHTPFAGMRLTGWPTHTILRGQVAAAGGKLTGRPAGRYLKRPIGLFADGAQ